MKKLLAAILSLVMLLAPVPALAASPWYTGANRIKVLRVIDGDTFTFTQNGGGLNGMVFSVRIKGLDTPEMHGTSPGERENAQKAKAFLESLVAKNHGYLWIKGKTHDPYGGRIEATVYLNGPKEVAQMVIEAGLGRAFDVKLGHRTPWC